MKYLTIFILNGLIFIGYHSTFAQKPYQAFHHISIDDGLSSNTIRSFCKDKTGLMWIGTGNGLNRYDGYSVKVFLPDANDENSIVGKGANALALDNDGNLWIGTDEALNKLDLHTNVFTHYFDVDTGYGKGISKMMYDKIHGVFWLSTKKSADVIVFNPATEETKVYKHDSTNPQSIGKKGVMQFLLDKKGEVWLTSWENGISKYNRETDDFTHYTYNPKDSNSIFKDNVYTIAEDGEGNIWASTINAWDGYITGYLNPKTGKFRRIRPGTNGAPQDVYYSTSDRDGNIWFCSILNGVYKYDIYRHIFSNFKHLNNETESLSENRIDYAYIDDANQLWLGSLNKGVNKANLNLRNVFYYELPQEDTETASGIIYMDEDKEKNIWMASTSGAYKLDYETNKIIRINLPKINGKEDIEKILVTPMGDVWVVNHTKLYNIDTKTLKVSQIHNSHMLNTNITSMHMDKKHNLYIVQDKSLTVYKKGDMSKDPIILSKVEYLEKYINCGFFEDGDNVWVSLENTFGKININDLKYTLVADSKTLNKRFPKVLKMYKRGNLLLLQSDFNYMEYNIKNNSFKEYILPFASEDEATPISYQYAYDKFCYSSYHGVYLFDRATKKYVSPKVFNSDKINPDVMIMSANGHIYLAAGNGFIVFNPKDLEDLSAHKPKIILEDFYLFNRTVKINGVGSPLKKQVNFLKHLELTHKQSVFTFELSLLNFDEVHKNQYAYMLEGFERTWNFIGNRKTATYTNIPAGDYVFKYKGVDKNGVWSDVESINVKIYPPYWETWWFRFIILCIILSIIYVVFRLRTKAIRDKKEELERQVILRTAEIVAQKEEILTQKEEIVQQQEKIHELYQDVTDSIQTAKKIQESILPPHELIKKHLADSFVMYLPKDIVSGDFYWFYAYENYTYIGAMDCAGHGVAGAFMSLIGYNLLNRIMSEEKGLSPKQILQRLNQYVIQVLNQESENSISRDGMDAAICMINKETNTITFAGANNPLYILRNEKIEIIKADNNSVGIQPQGRVSQFNDHLVFIEKDDQFYIFSDGIAGQFGGQQGQEKLKYNKFRDMLISVAQLPMDLQKIKLLQLLSEWQKTTEQTDDIMVIGMKI